MNRVAAVSTKGLTINDNYIWKQENRPVLEELVALFRIEETIDARCRVLTHSSNDTDEQIMNQIRGHGGMLGSERVRVFNNRMLPNHDRLLYASFALIESPSGFKPRPDIFSKIESNSIFDYKTYRRWNNHMSRIQSQIGDL